MTLYRMSVKLNLSWTTSQDVGLFRYVLYLTTFGIAGKDSDDLNRRLVYQEKLVYGSTFENDTNVN